MAYPIAYLLPRGVSIYWIDGYFVSKPASFSIPTFTPYLVLGSTFSMTDDVDSGLTTWLDKSVVPQYRTIYLITELQLISVSFGVWKYRKLR